MSGAERRRERGGERGAGPYLLIKGGANKGEAPTHIAFIEQGDIAEIWYRDDSHELGEVHLVRVTGVFPEHKRATGQLYDGRMVSWPCSHSSKLKQGELAVVTLTAFGGEDKPLQASFGAQLAGRYVLLSSAEGGAGQIRVSKKSGLLDGGAALIRQLSDKIDIKAFQVAGFDLVIRRRALSESLLGSESLDEMIAGEYQRLFSAWQADAMKAEDLRTETQPRLIYPGLPLVFQAELYAGYDDIRAGDEASWQEIIADLSGIGEPRYDCACGAILWIEPTRAAIMVDVDSGPSRLGPKPLAESVLPELLAQLRLRSLSGRILVDLPYLSASGRRHIIDLCANLVREDPRQPEITGYTSSGLLELRIRHRRPALGRLDFFGAGEKDVKGV